MSGRFFFPLSSRVLFGGSRSLLVQFASVVAELVDAALAAGCSVHVGCASGADQAVVSAVLAAGVPGRLAVFAVGGEGGSGFWSGSAPFSLLVRACAVADVRFLAGGDLHVPLKLRLYHRSLAALCGCSLAVFFAPGLGSLSVAGAAVAAGVPVLVVVAGAAPPVCAPRGCSGSWSLASVSGVSLPAGFSLFSWSAAAPRFAPAGQAVLPGFGF
jgi:hypothetical protein